MITEIVPFIGEHTVTVEPTSTKPGRAVVQHAKGDVCAEVIVPPLDILWQRQNEIKVFQVVCIYTGNICLYRMKTKAQPDGNSHAVRAVMTDAGLKLNFDGGGTIYFKYVSRSSLKDGYPVEYQDVDTETKKVGRRRSSSQTDRTNWGGVVVHAFNPRNFAASTGQNVQKTPAKSAAKIVATSGSDWLVTDHRLDDGTPFAWYGGNK